jgi:glycosyltransferase involved in cell wall biosynthesis
LLLYRDSHGSVDGIGDYSTALKTALCAAGADAEVLFWPSERIGAGDGIVVLQYNPFSFGRWGFAPRLPFDLMLLARRRPRLGVAVMVHEAYVPIDSVKSLIMGVWQRLQLRAVLASANVVMVTTSSWIPRLPAGSGAIPVPVGSNLPDRRDQREARRRMLGVGPDTLVLATFGGDHPTRLLDYVVAAANAIVATRAVILLHLGAGERPLVDLDTRVVLHRPGRQSDEEVAADLSAADLYLAPFRDGISTRRTTFIAALQHGLPVVGTDGPNTEADLRKQTEAIQWAPASDREAFVEAARRLASDEESRTSSATAARAMFDEHFDWDLIAARILAALTRARPMGII